MELGKTRASVGGVQPITHQRKVGRSRGVAGWAGTSPIEEDTLKSLETGNFAGRRENLEKPRRLKPVYHSELMASCLIITEYEVLSTTIGYSR